MLKVGLIGAGFMGGMHAACYKIIEGAEVVAIADVIGEKAEKLCENTDVAIYSSGDDLIKNADIDIVDICLPTYLHTTHAVKAMEKGRAVFIEKPVCLKHDEGKQLLDAQKKTGVQVMVGQCIRFWPEYMWLKSVVDNNKYGKLKSAVFTRISPKPTWSWDGWILDPARGGSAALDLHIHDTDYIRYLLGEPDDISSEASRDENGVIMQIQTSYKYKDSLVLAEGAWGYPPKFPFSMEYRVNFENAAVVYNSGNSPTLAVYTSDGSEEFPKITKSDTGSNDLGGNVSDLGGYYNELKYFVEKVKSGQHIKKSTLKDSVESFKLVVREIKSTGGLEPLY